MTFEAVRLEAPTQRVVKWRSSGAQRSKKLQYEYAEHAMVRPSTKLFSLKRRVAVINIIIYLVISTKKENSNQLRMRGKSNISVLCETHPWNSSYFLPHDLS